MSFGAVYFSPVSEGGAIFLSKLLNWSSDMPVLIGQGGISVRDHAIWRSSVCTADNQRKTSAASPRRGPPPAFLTDLPPSRNSLPSVLLRRGVLDLLDQHGREPAPIT